MRYPNEGTYCFLDGTDLVPVSDTRVGTSLVGRYQIEEVIGEGGMATVYRARHKLVERPCAIKIMNPLLATDEVVRERFRREAKSAQRLTHPNIIEIFDQGDTDDGTAYIAMELLRGSSLSELIAKGAIPIPRAIGLMIQIARGIARAHDFEVIHRDLKPENIFICRRDDGTDLAKLLDFGIARSRQDSRLTGAGELFGTPQYMAPERIERGEAGPSVDLYALGIIYFEMVTGKLPFDAPDVATFFVKHLHEKPNSTRKTNPRVPSTLDALILSLLAKDPKARPVDAHRVHQDLVAIANTLQVPVPPEPETDQAISLRPSQLQPAPRGDMWTRRTNVLEQMLTRAYGAKPPNDLSRLLVEMKNMMRRLVDLRAHSMSERRKLEQIEQRGREGRQRFGFAVDALGIDASRARDEMRVSRAMMALFTEECAQASKRFETVHKEIITWEGRSGFREPYAELAAAYRQAASGLDTWLTSRADEKKALETCNVHQQAVNDLEFQIKELRAALAASEQSMEVEQGTAEKVIIDISREVDGLEEQLFLMTTRFTEPLRKRPELAPLFKELDGEAAA